MCIHHMYMCAHAYASTSMPIDLCMDMHRPSVRVHRNHKHLLPVQHALLAAERATPAAVAGSLSLNTSAADDVRASVETLLDTLDLEGRLRDAFEQRAGQPPAQLVDSVIAEIELFAAGHVFPDDVCLVSMEIAHLEASEAQLVAT